MAFREKFKYYKQKIPKPKFDDVIDFSQVPEGNLKDNLSKTVSCAFYTADLPSLGLKVESEWRIFELVNQPGLIIICNPFTGAGQRLWIERSLSEYTRKPSKLNLDAHGDLKNEEDWWTICCSDPERSKVLRRKLRWATLGYHHNWDTKKYSEDSRSDFPVDLAKLSQVIIHTVLGQKNFFAEAAIVNFYHMDSTLSGHVDSSETNLEAPLISFSFGQSAIFLIGSSSLEDEPTAMFIHSGDVIIMSGPSRHCYHGVPRIIPHELSPWNESIAKTPVDDIISKDFYENSGNIHDNWVNFSNYIKTSRINLNVRQVSYHDEINSEKV